MTLSQPQTPSRQWAGGSLCPPPTPTVMQPTATTTTFRRAHPLSCAASAARFTPRRRCPYRPRRRRHCRHCRRRRRRAWQRYLRPGVRLCLHSFRFAVRLLTVKGVSGRTATQPTPRRRGPPPAPWPRQPTPKTAPPGPAGAVFGRPWGTRVLAPLWLRNARTSRSNRSTTKERAPLLARSRWRPLCVKPARRTRCLFRRRRRRRRRRRANDSKKVVMWNKGNSFLNAVTNKNGCFMIRS
mmetsp:Transcript_68150/g.133689  ORF Transcript_68150/g.133689 Transcript_68150/m.133689 type:complete len:240 (+) Transcript_68150:950-1669(+)